MASTPDPRAAAAAAAHRRVKRCIGLLRAAAATLAPEASDVDIVGELRLEQPEDFKQLEDLVRLNVHRYGAVDVVLVASPSAAAETSRRSPSDPSRRSSADPASRARART